MIYFQTINFYDIPVPDGGGSGEHPGQLGTKRTLFMTMRYKNGSII